MDAGQLLLRVCHHVFVLDEEEAGLVVVVARQQRRVAFLEVADQTVVAQELLCVVGLGDPHEAGSAGVDVAHSGDDLRLVGQQVFEHLNGRCLGPVPRLVDHHRLVHLGVLGVHDAAQNRLDLIYVRRCLLCRTALPRLKGVEHHLAQPACRAGVDIGVLVKQRSKYGAARTGETSEEVEGFGH